MDLKKFRFDYHLGQNELAELLGCTQANVSRLENGARSITGSQVASLIEKYGVDVIARYADPSELPAGPVVSIDLSKSKTEISGNQGPVNNGSGTQTTVDASLVNVMNKQVETLNSQSAQISALIQQHSALLEQQARLIALLEASQNK